MNDRPKTRVSLILRLSQPADAEAWEEFCDIYMPVICRIAKARGLQDADAHDVSQKVLVRVAQSVKNWSPDPDRGSFGAWLGTIARNLLIDFLRSPQNHHQTAGGSDIERLLNKSAEEMRGDQDFENLIDAEIQHQLFVWAAEKVESAVQPATWTAFWRTAVQHHPVASVAEDLQMSAGAIYVARSRVIARKKIRSSQQPLLERCQTIFAWRKDLNEHRIRVWGPRLRSGGCVASSASLSTRRTSTRKS